MSSDRNPIPVPSKLKWQIFRRTRLPIIWFSICLVLMLWMWTRRSPQVIAMGQVEALTVVVPAENSGILQPLDVPLIPFDHVDQDVSLVAKIDTSNQMMEMEVMIAERHRLSAMIKAESENLRLEQIRLDQQHNQVAVDQEQRLLAVQRSEELARSEIENARETLDDIRREISDLKNERRQIILQTAQAESTAGELDLELQGLRNQTQRIRDQVRLKMAPAYKLTQWNSQLTLKETMQQENRRLKSLLRGQMAQIDKDSQLTKQRYVEATRHLQSVTNRIRKTVDDNSPSNLSISDSSIGDLSTNGELLVDASGSKPGTTLVTMNRPVLDSKASLQPLKEALSVQDRKIQALTKRIAGNEVKAPISGMITKIHHPAGTYVPSGEPIVTIASDQSQWIVAYLDQFSSQTIRPGDDVDVIVRDRRVRGSAKVIRLGSQYQPLPVHLRDVPENLELGLPLQVSVPKELGLLPGEIVELVF